MLRSSYPVSQVLRFFCLVIVVAVGFISLVGTGDGDDPKDNALDLEVELSAPAFARVGVPFSVSASASGTGLSYQWWGLYEVGGMYSNTFVQDPIATVCASAEQILISRYEDSLSVHATGSPLPGTFGRGEAEKKITVYPPAHIAFEDGEFGTPAAISPEGWSIRHGGRVNETGAEFTILARGDTYGNPDAFLYIRTTYTDTSDDMKHLYVIMEYQAQTYDPSINGALYSVQFNFDSRMNGDAEKIPSRARFRPVLFQSGQMFFTVQPDSHSKVAMYHSPGADWIPFRSFPLIAEYFENWQGTHVPGSSNVFHPDFSASGAPIHFGIMVNFEFRPAEAGYVDTDIDNFEVITSTPWSAEECKLIHDLCPDRGSKSQPGVCGCNGDDQDIDGDGAPDCFVSPTCPDVSGSWTLDVSDITSSCGSEGDWSDPVEIAQTDCDLTITGIKGASNVTRGKVSETRLSINAHGYPDFGGTTTSRFALVIESAIDSELVGVENFNWSSDSGLEHCYTGHATAILRRP